MINPFSVALRVLTILTVLFSLSGHAHAESQKYRRTVENYTVPDVILVNQDGAKVRLKELLQSGKPVIVEFIFATCTTICPVLSASFVSLQQKLGNDSQKVHLISISIDPENDTPKVMKAYLKRYRAKPGWDFLTGSRKDIDNVMRAFDAYIPNKMSHFPLTLIRSPSDGTWVRIFGLMGSSEFLFEFNKVGAK
jgi:protein SCO1/2